MAAEQTRGTDTEGPVMVDAVDLSIVIPHLNEPDDLRRCLAALKAQQAPGVRFEVIVVDNGSRVLPQFATELIPGLRLLREAIPGPGPARNAGAAAARAPILAFIDADCIAEPGWIAAIVRCFAQRPEIAFIAGDIRIRATDPANLTAIECYESVYSYRTKLYAEQYGFAATGNMAVRAEVFRAVGPFGGIASMEDTEWGQRATAMGYCVTYLAEARVKTPSCKTFGELARRWDRHVAHEFKEVRGSRSGQLKWLAKTMIMALSPVGEIPKVTFTDRLSSWRERILALGCVARVRLYRARRMAGLIWHDNAASLVDIWNRDSSL